MERQVRTTGLPARPSSTRPTHPRRASDNPRPRLLLLGPHTPAPIAENLLEDRARLPLSVVDLRTQLATLRRHAHGRPPRPVVDDDGRLLYRDRWVGLSRRQAPVAKILVARYQQPVNTRDLVLAWDKPAYLDVLFSCIAGLRARVEPIGLQVTAIRRHGYLLQPRP